MSVVKESRAGDEAVINGECLCGRLHFRVIGQPHRVNCCHCRDCQRTTGSAFAINAIYPADRVEMLSPTVEEDILTDENGSQTWRCSGCGLPLFWTHRAYGASMRFVRVGTLDQGECYFPDAHFFVRSKHHWVMIPEGVPQYDTLPDFSKS